jgi:hypothetical protein
VDLPIENGDFSIVMLVYQRVPQVPLNPLLKIMIFQTSKWPKFTRSTCDPPHRYFAIYTLS